MIGIYKITNSINDKVYIGQSENIERRWKEHEKDSKTKHYALYLAMRKYGIENFKFEVIEECSIKELDEKEIYYIEQHNSYIHAKDSNGYNMTLGGKTTRGCKWTEESKKKSSESHKGKTFSQEHKEKISNAHKGKIISEETRQKIKENHADFSGENSYWYGKNLSDEAKKKISESRIGAKNHRARKVICNGKEFDCIKDCADFYGINNRAMANWLRNNKIPKKYSFLNIYYID